MSIWDETKAWHLLHPRWQADDIDSAIGAFVLFAVLATMIMALLEIEFLLAT